MATHAPITGAPTRAPLFAVPVLGSDRHLHLKATPPRVTNRRELLAFVGAATALGGAVVTGGVALAADAIATPFAVAEANYRATTARFNMLPEDLEFTDPAAHSREERQLYDTCDALEAAPIADLREFALAFLAIHHDGDSHAGPTALRKLAADAKRLTGAA